MKRKLFWRSVLRRPLAAVLIVLLLGAAALGVGEKFTEYSAVSSQVDALNDYYRPIGQLVSTDGDVGAGAELISSSAYVDLSDTRRYVTGVLDGLYNADIDGNSSGYEGSPTGVNVSEILAYAELLSKERSAEGGYEYMFRVTEAVYGYPERVGEKMRLLMYHADDGDEAFALEDRTSPASTSTIPSAAPSPAAGGSSPRPRAGSCCPPCWAMRRRSRS